MNRRDFLKSALTIAAFAPVMKLAAGAMAAAGLAPKQEPPSKEKVSRRRYKDTDLTLPLLGFGLMRLPKLRPNDSKIDRVAAKKMIARAFASGVNYFDTAYMYHGGDSENFAGEALSDYPRESYLLASKMPVGMLKTPADTERIFREQLAKCRTGYFDFYLLHNLNRSSWPKAVKFKVWEFLRQQQKEGKIRKLGFSFHDTPEFLQTIVSAHEWDFAQIQLNYLDWTLYRSREQYEILTAKKIPIIIMEPLKGGMLARMNPEARRILHQADPHASIASWGIRYAASLPNVLCVLSGMSAADQVEDNIRTLSPLRELTEEEKKMLLGRVVSAERKSAAIACTGCRYCMPCPADVEIPKIFEIYNRYRARKNRDQFLREYRALGADCDASACVSCGACRSKCPQHLDIPKELAAIAKTFAALNKN
ncbi:MAG: aldo/keto reductase [Victivallaceae bacterium]|nr:aldo/keto reductase [Victivallaceae bacterium]